MVATGAYFLAAGFPPGMVRSCVTPSSGKMKSNPVPKQTRRFAVPTEQMSTGTANTTATTTSFTENARLEMERLEEERERITKKQKPLIWELAEAEMKSRKSLKDYFEESKDLIRSEGGPPRWLSPLECGSRLDKSPLLLYLPGIDGVGLGLIRQHHSLGKLFDIWCLHIPVKDRTPFTDLVKLVEHTVKSEHQRSPDRPIYLVGESLGACLGLAVAALNPDIDLVLILANPGTSFQKSQLAPLVPLLAVIPNELELRFPYMQSLMTGNPLKAVMDTVIKRLPLQQLFGELFQDFTAASSYLSVLSDMLPRETILWKLKLLKSASEYANSRLHSVNAQTLILSSGNDKLLPSQVEGERLHNVLPKFVNMWQEDEFDLGTVIKGTSFYRRGPSHDYISDYIRPSPAEFKKIYESIRWVRDVVSPVMLSTFEDGKIDHGLAGIPSEGPVLFIGHHLLMALDLYPMLPQLLLERNILLRGIAHPMMFMKSGGLLAPLSQLDIVRQMGAVPVSGKLLYKLLSSKAHVLLYPGGMREANHGKGEEYKLFWPEQSEFVRMAARFGAKIVPFGVVGEDDFFDVFFDFDDQKFPLKEIAEQFKNVRTELRGEARNQDMHFPVFLPQLPGRLYYYFGKPIETEGRRKELEDREKAQELYLQVKTEVEKCLAFLKEKRKSDPYRSILTRMIYQSTHGYSSEIPTFEL
ncbi:acyltransferase-like protein At3g26840, chloroplastic isoform X3 [Jatropha curcas]|uniref:acyltransferase-like protein At3g26840, chloroplastic isoform X3 n=1 Tax=Jatropha curcas TaxID=180498 RepID=UPI0009D687D1|nr:acyltransferase-like protein At3g26840, chloroplastic isoform X3 [Jatropha curcas]